MDKHALQPEGKIVWDLEICKNIDLLKRAGSVILYGAGGKGHEIFGWLKDAGIDVRYFCDMDVNKWGKRIADVEVIAPSDLKYRDFTKGESYIIACIPAPRYLCDLLKHLDVKTLRLVTYWGIQAAIHLNMPSIYPSASQRAAMLQIERKRLELEFVNCELGHLSANITCSNEAIWIVQSGKTASSSLEAAFQNNNIPFIKDHQLTYKEYILGKEFRQLWENWIRQRRQKVKVITAVREPLSRDYSAFWQAATTGRERLFYMPFAANDFQRLYENFIGCIRKGSAYTKEKLGIFMPEVWMDEFIWFDEQIKQYLDIDVFQYPFDREKGYALIQKGNVELFLFKVEKINSDAVLEGIRAFTGTKELSIERANAAEQKWYSLAYAQFKKEVKLPRGYVDYYYIDNSKVDHFYTQEEKAQFLSKWRNNIDEGTAVTT